jgi:hypothetical protein
MHRMRHPDPLLYPLAATPATGGAPEYLCNSAGPPFPAVGSNGLFYHPAVPSTLLRRQAEQYGMRE